VNTYPSSRQQQGHTIVLTLVVSLVLGVVLMGIIKLANNEGQMTGRSQNWNAVMPLVEAGIEEALTHLKYSPTNRAENGWTLDPTDNRYTRTRNFQDGMYKVTISKDHDPVIISRGWLRAPGQKDFSITRVVRVRATNEPLFLAGIEGTTSIRLTGHIRVDSYDSRDPSHSSKTGGYDPARPKAGGDIASYGGTGAIDIGNSHVYGHVKTSPGTTYTIGSGGSVGDFNWSQGVQPGWAEEVPEMEYPPIFAPKGGGQPLTGTGANKDYQYVLGNAVYEVPAVAGSLLVTANANATLVVNNSFKISGKDTIFIQPGATLKLYVKAADANFSGQAVINPATPSTSLMYYGLPSNTSIDMSGNSAFNGVIYAPNATVKLRGGGNDGVDFSGAIIAATVAANGHYNFHYDEATRRLGSRGIVAASWDEISPTGIP
jgi:hypothetical protein